MDVDGVGADSSRRTNAAAEAWEIKQTLNASIPPSPASSSTASRVKLAQGRDPNSFPSRYMFERRGERGEALDDQLDLVTTLLIETYGLSEEDISDPSIVSQESVYAVGRICPALNPNSASAKDQQQTGLPRLQPIAGGMLIESSKLQGAGQRVPIWFTKECVIRRPPGAEDDGEVATATSAELLGLFPGMLVGIKGRNGGGDGFGVEEVLLVSYSDRHQTTPPSDADKTCPSSHHRFRKQRLPRRLSLQRSMEQTSSTVVLLTSSSRPDPTRVTTIWNFTAFTISWTMSRGSDPTLLSW